ncbi:hypothetical protein [Bacteroides pyogenes]|uniref:hypothetical protein n=1 Tax=Bacteroides pyogenes TaxID=310300 RepID=UPI001BA4DE0A|nr:hypothetical protein [Bacteroides pyogenes]MBR8706894.1 hypothetical protein [Bacteroides pyogenes]MBR8726175.1 hypothetical protein [Bacteroides pyogenes]MBR8739554.1 hypothetical protein [Bacteroides pyogenes]MBR8755404.1 hypothetical protein [Bacteroides pyogenes]MBR8796668.1 hypothetical protein [Bacteroides pyogenes]
MRIKGDASGLDELSKRIDDAFYNALAEAGKESVSHAQNIKTYQNRTYELVNANGYCVVRDGQIVEMGVKSDGTHPKAVEETENLMIYATKPRDGLYLANGKPYASHVESKGFEVITSAKFYAANRIRKKLKIR